MSQILDWLNEPQNLLYSFLMSFSLGIWLLSSLGWLGSSETDAGVEVDSHLETDWSINQIFSQAAAFVGFGRVPLSIVLTVLMFVQGFFGVLGNHFINPEKFFHHLLIFLGSFTLSFFATALLTRLLSPIFKDYGKALTANEIVGKVAILTSNKVSPMFGQATVKLANGEIIEIAVRSTEENNQIRYGESLLVIDYIAEKNIYLIDKLP